MNRVHPTPPAPIGPWLAAAAVTAAVLRSIGGWALLLSGLLAAAEVGGAIDLGQSIWVVPLLFAAIGVVHEWGHLVAIVLLGGDIVGAGRVGRVAVGISHCGLGRFEDAICVCAGPLMAAAAGLTIAYVLWPTAAAFLVAMIGLGHLITLAVPVGDGAALRAVFDGSSRPARSSSP